MNNVAAEVEADPTYTQIIEASRKSDGKSVADGIVSAAREIAETTDVKAICCFSQSGATASLVARERPRVPIVALTSYEDTARRLVLSWGTNCVIVGKVDRFKDAVIAGVQAAKSEGVAGEDDMVVVTAGVPFNTPGSTNILRVAPCDERKIFPTEGES